MRKFGKAGSTLATVLAAAIVLAIVSTTGAVAGSLITSKQIKNNTIKSKDVKNNNLKGIDIADGSLAKDDLAAAAQGYTSIVTKRVTVPGVANNTTSTVAVDCGAGKVAIGGGGYTSPSGIVLLGTTVGILEQSMPAATSAVAFIGSVPAGDNVAPQAWRTTVRNNDGSATTNVHYAICASK